MTIPYKYDELAWMESTKNKNMCGFHSIANVIQELLQDDVFIGNANSLLIAYLQESTVTKVEDLEVNAALSMKQAFVACLRADESGKTPFDDLMESDIIQYMGNEDGAYEDVALKKYIQDNKDKFVQHYEKYKELAEAHLRENPKEFYKYVLAHDLSLIERAKDAFCRYIEQYFYEARAMDLIYLVKQFDYFGNLVIHNVVPGSPEPAVMEVDFEEGKTVDLHLRNVGQHWEAAKPVRAAPAANQRLVFGA